MKNTINASRCCKGCKKCMRKMRRSFREVCRILRNENKNKEHCDRER